MKIIANLASEQLSDKRMGEFDTKQEMLEMMTKLNSGVLRNHCLSHQTSSEYHERVLSIGNRMLLEFSLST